MPTISFVVSDYVEFSSQAFFTLSDGARQWIVTSGAPLVITSGVLALVLSLVVLCVPSIAQKYPTNYILLTFFTLFESIGLGGLCAVVSKLDTRRCHVLCVKRVFL